ncbi:Virginiamycin A acetyltransferase [Candidatus Rubidus massiliensis]|nr:Virginiamycin A acetyltransferase [Candidatus Rubidus massiliensis]
MTGPHPNSLYPIKDHDKLIFLKNFVKAPNIFIGDYTYFDNSGQAADKFEENNVLYNYDFSKVKLVIGKFCAIAAQTRFIMTGDHKLDAISTYPFPIFGHGWESAFNVYDLPVKGDITVGNDVWFGYDSLVMNGVTIGNGAIIAARAVVVKDVPAYSIVAGNPAKVVKMRFDDKTIERLQKIAWWDWKIEKISKHLQELCHLNIDALEMASKEE